MAMEGTALVLLDSNPLEGPVFDVSYFHFILTPS